MTRSFALLIALALALPAYADTSARAKVDATAAYNEGQRRYLAEDYEGAAKQFLIAYELDPDPAYLFNIAQAYRFAKQCALSAKHYRRFLEVVRNPPNKTDVAKYITEQDACAKTQPRPKPDQPDQPPDPKPEPDPVPKPDPKVDARPRTPTDPGRLRKRLAIGSFAAGVVGLGLGVAYAIRIESIEKDAEALCEGTMCTPDHRIRRAALDERAASSRSVMIVGFAAGGVAIASGVFLYVTGKQRSERVAITPTRTGAFVSLTFSH